MRFLNGFRELISMMRAPASLAGWSNPAAGPTLPPGTRGRAHSDRSQRLTRRRLRLLAAGGPLRVAPRGRGGPPLRAPHSIALIGTNLQRLRVSHPAGPRARFFRASTSPRRCAKARPRSGTRVRWASPSINTRAPWERSAVFCVMFFRQGVQGGLVTAGDTRKLSGSDGSPSSARPPRRWRCCSRFPSGYRVCAKASASGG